MIQRKQTIYLGVAAVLLIVATTSLARANPSGEPVYLATQILAAGMALVCLGSIFLYGQRERQYKVVVWARAACLLIVAAIGAQAYLSGQYADVLALNADDLTMAALATLVSTGLVHAAAKAVKRDILLVASMDRIR